MQSKYLQRRRRAAKTRAKIRQQGIPRLLLVRTSKHLYAQVTVSSKEGDRVLASASTLDKEIRAAGGITNNQGSASVIGSFVAKRALAAGIKRVAFDRSGFKYHGCVKVLAEAAREAGLPF